MDCDVVVIGAGPGGCATAYHLQQAGWQVTLAERRTYPVDKLCGEFLSPEGVESLQHLGLGDALQQDAAPHIGAVLVSSVSGRTWHASLPARGRGLSRRRMDHLLVERCHEVGVDVRLGLHIREVAGNFEHGFHLRGHGPDGGQELKTRLVVGAFGKQSVLHRKLHRDVVQHPSHPLMALKLYATGDRVPGRVELHAFPGGYAGLCEVEGGKTNLSLLTEARAFRRVGGDYERFGAEVLAHNPLLQQRLAALRPNWRSAFAIANLVFGSRARTAKAIMMVGDAAASISPLCGDGMAMALQTGEILAPLANRFLAGQLTDAAMLCAYDRRWRQEFTRRLRVGRGLQHVLLTPSWGTAAITLLRLFPGIGQQLIRWTRG